MRATVLKSMLLCLALLPLNGQAAFLHFIADLDADQQSATVVSAGTGAAGIVLNTLTSELSWSLVYEGLTAPLTATHFHGPAPAGVDAGVQVNIATNSTVGATGSTAGLFQGSAILSASQVADLSAGLWYINIHTSTYPPGEIRGQVLPATAISAVPLPGALVLLLSAVGGIAAPGIRHRFLNTEIA